MTFTVAKTVFPGTFYSDTMFVFHNEHAILRKAKPRVFDGQFIQTGNYGEHRKFAYRETTAAVFICRLLVNLHPASQEAVIGKNLM